MIGAEELFWLVEFLEFCNCGFSRSSFHIDESGSCIVFEFFNNFEEFNLSAEWKVFHIIRNVIEFEFLNWFG